MNEFLNIKGNVNVILYDNSGSIKQLFDWQNIIVNNGKDWIIDRLGSNTPETCSHIAIGTGTTAAAATDIQLESQTAIVNGSVSQPTSTQHQVVSTFGAGIGTGTITEYGLYASGSSLIGHLVTGSISKAVDDSLQVTYILSIT